MSHECTIVFCRDLSHEPKLHKFVLMAVCHMKS
jgi:hypothetical protein